MKLWTALLAALVATAMWLAGSSGWADAQPEATVILPEDGATISELPEIIHMCFSEPVVVLDNTTFNFKVAGGDATPLGLRIVFQRDGLGVDLYLGRHDGPPEGAWTFEWKVLGAATQEPASGKTTFEVAADGEPPPGKQERCSDPRTPSPKTPEATSTPASNSDDASGPDVAVIILVAVVAVSLAAILGSVFSIVRRWRGGGGP